MNYKPVWEEHWIRLGKEEQRQRIWPSFFWNVTQSILLVVYRRIRTALRRAPKDR
jgi:hypothetical protein